MKKALSSIFLLALLLACKHEYPELPNETSAGRNTFGCLVNGELVIPFDTQTQRYYTDRTHAEYNRRLGRLKITTQCQNYQRFEFIVNHPQHGQAVIIDTAIYVPPKSSGAYGYASLNSDRIELTRFDTLSGVVSGRFQLTGYGYSTADKQIINPADFVTITNGRFDIEITFVNF